MDDDKKKKKFDLIDVRLMLTLAGAGCIIGLFYILIGKIDGVILVVQKLLRAMAPIIIGFIIAFILNPVVNKFRVGFRTILNKLFNNKKSDSSKTILSEEKTKSPKYIKDGEESSEEFEDIEKQGFEKLSNILAVIFAMLLFIAIIVSLLWVLIPQLYESVTRLYENIDTYTQNIENLTNKIVRNFPELTNIMNNYMSDIETTIKDLFANTLLPNMDSIVKAISNGIVGGVKLVLNFVIGIIAAVYILLGKDKYSAQSKKILYALFARKTANRLMSIWDYVEGVFSGFIGGKIIDSFIIGIICFAFCRIVGMPYAVLISVIIGVTNIIPFFGPFIGAIPSAVLVLVESPKMCIVFVIFILVLQQIDGNILGPLILSDSTGLSSFWVLFAILVGGNLFGFAGMVLGVPTFACIYTLMTHLIRDGLNKKGIANETELFVALRSIDEDGNPIKGPKKKIESMSDRKKREKQLKQLRHSKELLDKVTHHDKKESDKKED